MCDLLCYFFYSQAAKLFDRLSYIHQYNPNKIPISSFPNTQPQDTLQWALADGSASHASCSSWIGTCQLTRMAASWQLSSDQGASAAVVCGIMNGDHGPSDNHLGGPGTVVVCQCRCVGAVVALWATTSCHRCCIARGLLSTSRLQFPLNLIIESSISDKEPIIS